jgi:purine-binding chemotaxis protein CheW
MKKGAKDKSEENSAEALLHLVIFKLGSEHYGIKIEQVKEVTLTPPIAKMPQTPSFIKGVANIRGDIIAIMDLEERFKLQSSDLHLNKRGLSYTLVIESPIYTIGLMVQEVPQSLTISVSDIDRTPDVVKEKNINENFIEGIGKIDDGRLIIILDINKILSTEEIELLQEKVEAKK